MVNISELVKEAQKGDSESAGRLFELYKDQLYFYVKNHIGNQSDAEDVLQDIFVSVFQSIKKLEDPDIFNAWIYKIAYRRIMDYHRKGYAAKDIFSDTDDSVLANAEDLNTEFIPGKKRG